MSTSVAVKQVETRWEPPPTVPLDEGVWRAWQAKGRTGEHRDYELRMAAVKWVSIATLVAAAGVWSYLAGYGVAVRFAVAVGAMVTALEALQLRRYAYAPLFAALVVVYNPAFPVFNFSGELQRAVVVASTVPFLVALGWHSRKVLSNV
jgi:hypothetical protein